MSRALAPRPRALALGLALAAAGAARADVTPAQLAQVGLHTPANATLPLDLPFRDGAGRATTLRRVAGGEPLVVIFADYGCTTLCGPALSVTAARLRETGLAPGRDYRLAVLGLDPASTPAQAQAFGAARLGEGAPLLAAAALLTGPATAQAARAAGYGYAYDAQAHQFTHPVAAFTVTPDGRISASLSEINLTARALRGALTAAGQGEVTGWTDQLALICHAALQAVGRFDGTILIGLRAAGVATLLAMAGALAWLIRRRRGAPA